VDAVWFAISTLAFIYLFHINPALYVEYWADDKHQWAQMWMADHYTTGSGGLRESDSMLQLARLSEGTREGKAWLDRAADRNPPEALFMLAKQAMTGI